LVDDRRDAEPLRLPVETAPHRPGEDRRPGDSRIAERRLDGVGASAASRTRRNSSRFFIPPAMGAEPFPDTSNQ
jgi:hypothetical protein